MDKIIKIVADENIPFLKGVLEPFANIEYYSGREINREKIINSDALIVRTRTNCNRKLLHNTSVKIITTATIGFDHIDTNYCLENGIKWSNAPGCNSSAVMQYVISAIVAIAEKNDLNLEQMTLGVIGVGNVGKKVVKAAKSLGLKVLQNDPPRARIEGDKEFCSIEDIKNNADIISFHVPLNYSGSDKTFHIADEKFFNELKKKPIIINSSRGEVIKTSALKRAIKNKLLRNVVLDVWENEPNIDIELLNLVDIATPHIAGYSIEGKANGTVACVKNINKFFNFGLNQNWYPQNLPEPLNLREIKFDTKIDDRKVLFNSILNSYNIWDDDKMFRNSVSSFEKLRNEYRVRREFSFYKIISDGISNELKEKLELLGFIIA